MSQQQNSYPIFEGNQVLTSSQLNRMVAYLDEQTRLTRAKLIGTGIFCGLETSYDSAAVQLTITEGLGVSSQGFLMGTADCVFDRYKSYSLPAGVSYPPFENPETKVQDVTLFELVTPTEEVLPGETVLGLDDPANFLDDKVVLLFLECADIDLKSCLGQGCDERGMDRVFTLRKLLISQKDMEVVLSRTCSTQAGLYPDQYTLPEVIIRRALFDAENEQSSNYFRFSENYVNQIRGDQFVSGVSTGDLFNNLINALKQTYTDFAAILGPIYGGTNPFDGLPTTEWTNFLNGNSAGPNYLGIQYFYDFVKDLILAYDEFRDCAFELVSACCPDMDCFPKHLMLGNAIPVEASQPSRYRNGLVLSPAFNEQKDLLEKVIMLHKRMVIMTRQFDLDTVNNPSTTPVPPSDLGVPLYITPSNEKRDPLSLRSIPYYYNINTEEAGLGTLLQNWDYTYTQKYLFSKGLTPLAYGQQDIVQTNDQGPIKTPLYYNTDPYNFLRIEGAIRQNYVDVTAELENLKAQFDLPFNIVTLRLTGEPLDDIAERCDFDDLRTEYGSLRTEILDMSQRLFDRYATNEGGGVRLKGFPAFISALISDANSGTNLGSVTQPQTGVALSASVSTGQETRFAIQLDGSPIYAPERTMSQATSYWSNNVFQLASKLNDIIQTYLPFNITDFDFGYTGTSQNSSDGFIQVYLDAVQFAINVKVALGQIYDLIIRSLELKNNQDLYLNLMLYLREEYAQLENFITDARYQSLILLNYTYAYRLNYLQLNDQNLFSNFIKKHPGVEHMAGVPRGGTYIMLVNGNGVTVDKPSRDYAVSQIRDLQNLKVEREKLRLKPARTVQDDLKLKRVDSQILQLEHTQTELADSVPVEKYMLESYQVIADFTLPYLCCCDCECSDIPAVTVETELGIPAIGKPFYVEYSLGDYAYSKDVDFGKSDTGQGNLLINIEGTLQYQRSLYGAGQIKLYLVDRNGNKLLPSGPPSGEFSDDPSMPTYNAPNDPSNLTQYGTVAVRTYATGQAPQFNYTPQVGFSGVDSWHYMFEIEDATGTVVKRSTMGTVTVNVQ